MCVRDHLRQLRIKGQSVNHSFSLLPSDILKFKDASFIFYTFLRACSEGSYWSENCSSSDRHLCCSSFGYAQGGDKTSSRGSTPARHPRQSNPLIIRYRAVWLHVYYCVCHFLGHAPYSSFCRIVVAKSAPSIYLCRRNEQFSVMCIVCCIWLIIIR